MKLIKLSFFLFSILILSACIPEFKNPLSKPGEQKLDERLAGKWIKTGETTAKGKKPDLHYKFTMSADKKYYVVKSWKINNGVRKDSKSLMQIHTSNIANKMYINVKPHKPKENKKPAGYLILKYKIDGDKLSLSITNPVTIRNAIKNGGLRGKIPQYKRADGTMADSGLKSPKVTSSRRKLRKFFIKYDQQLFDKELMTIHRDR